jgi:hypothetical protein
MEEKNLNMKNKINMDSLNLSVVELSEEEKLEIIGGDKFLHDIGEFFGKIANAFVNQHPDSGARTAWTALH